MSGSALADEEAIETGGGDWEAITARAGSALADKEAIETLRKPP